MAKGILGLAGKMIRTIRDSKDQRDWDHLMQGPDREAILRAGRNHPNPRIRRLAGGDTEVAPKTVTVETPRPARSKERVA